jgi:hypothetical protein
VTAQANISIRKRKTSEILAIAASEILLAIDIADTFIAQGGYGFLQLTNQQRGPLVGIPSIVLFFMASLSPLPLPGNPLPPSVVYFM